MKVSIIFVLAILIFITHNIQLSSCGNELLVNLPNPLADEDEAALKVLPLLDSCCECCSRASDNMRSSRKCCGCCRSQSIQDMEICQQFTTKPILNCNELKNCSHLSVNKSQTIIQDQFKTCTFLTVSYNFLLRKL